MKNIFTLVLLFFTVALFAQPVNDDCSGIIDLGVVPFCPVDTFFTNLDATATDIGNDNVPTGCNPGGDWTFTGRDVWFQFTSSDTIINYTFTVTGITDGMGSDPLSNPQIAIYRGDLCGVDELALFACSRADDGEGVLEFDLNGLDFNTVYFIRINDWSPSAAPNSGSFQLCIDERDPISTIDESGSTACTGELYDSGGPDGDYSPNEDNIFSICPTAPNNGCVTFNLEYFNIGDDGDVINFYDGPDNSGAPINSLDGFDFNGPNNGGVCYSVQASSGCLTVEMTTDGNVEFEGFAASWECSIMPCDPPDVITVDNNITDQDIIDNITTPTTLVTIDTIICENGAYGTFLAGDDTDLGLDQGLLLTSGLAADVAAPAGGVNISTGNGTLGDDDLDYLSSLGNGSPSNDACIVELDVFVATNELNFEYVFGSEEYPEFVGGTFNDIFAFLVSGPGIVGDPMINNQLNIATLPGTMDPVEINSVNNSTNWQYYRNNEDGQSVAYDGLTSDFLGVKKSLTATVNVTPCETYHLKLAVADRGDNILDSGVFIGELKGGTPSSSLSSTQGLDFLVEDCTGTEDEVVFTLNSPQDEEQTYNVVIGGTATRDVDYILDMPDSITIAAGQIELSFSIIPLSDLLNEGTETITIQLTNNFGCGVVELTTLEIDLLDQPVVEINAGLDTILVCQDSCAFLTATGAATFFWTPPGLFNDDTSPTPIACPTTSQWITVSGSIGALAGCSDVDSVFLQIIDPTMMIETDDVTDICEGDSVRLTAVNNVNNLNLSWTPAAGLDDANSQTPVATPTTTTTYTATVDVFGCLATDDITINVDPFDFPDVIDDLTVCQGSVVQLADDIQNSTTQFTWTPADYLDDENLAGATATLVDPANINYVLTATSASGFCSQQDSVMISILPAEVDIVPDTVYICLGDSIDITVNTSTNGVGLTWSPNDSITTTMDETTTVFPTISTWYFASLDVGACSVMDSVFVRVDSLPNLAVMADPEKDPYCSGEIVSLTSPIFDPDAYPDIEHLWTPDAGQETDSTFFNLVVMTFDTITYFRTTTNNACSATSMIRLNVIPPIELEITPDTTVCEGEMVQLNVSSDDPAATFEWTPSAGLSCTDCPDPIATLTDSIDYTVAAMVFGCPADAGVLVNVVSEPELELPTDLVLCLGESITLNTLVDPEATYLWTSTDPNFGEVTDPTPTVTPDDSYTYFVTMTKDACGSIQAEVPVTVIINLLNIPSDTTICAGDTLQLDATSTSPNAVYLWTPSSGLSCTDCPTPISILSDTIQYTVAVDAEGCNSSTTFMVFVEEQPLLDVPSDTTVCAGEPVNLNGIIDPNATYTWTSDDPNFNDLMNPSPTVNPDGSFTYSVVMSKAFCPTIEDQVTVSAVINEVTISADTSVCGFEPVQLNITSTDPNATFTWTPDTGLSCTDCPNPTTILGDTIEYTVVADVNGGCQTFEDVIVNAVQLPEVSLSDLTTICLNDIVALNTIFDPQASYSWTSTNTPFTSTDPTPIDAPLITTTYIVDILKDGCTIAYEGMVEVVQPATLTADPIVEGCLGDEVTLNAQATPSSPADVYSWVDENGASSGNTPSITFTANVPDTSRYFVTLNNGCDNFTQEVILVTNTPASFSPDSIITDSCSALGELITASLAGTYPSGTTATWFLNDVEVGTGSEIMVQIVDLSSTLRVDLLTREGCLSSEEKVLCVQEPQNEMPNAFTPDGDDLNDVFGPVTLGLYNTISFRIWDRYGQLVFNNEDPDGWNGTYKDKNMPSDVYLYHIVLRNFNGETIEYEGHVSLIR